MRVLRTGIRIQIGEKGGGNLVGCAAYDTEDGETGHDYVERASLERLRGAPDERGGPDEMDSLQRTSTEQRRPTTTGDYPPTFPPPSSAASSTSSLSLSLFTQATPSLLLSLLGLIFTGQLLDHLARWHVFHRVDELFILVPVLGNLKGNLRLCSVLDWVLP